MPPGTGAAGPDQAAALSWALETLADLGVVELGTDEDGAGSLTVALSPLGRGGVHRRLRAQGWHVPVLGAVGRDGAQGLLAALANCDAEDGESEITAWLARAGPRRGRRRADRRGRRRHRRASAAPRSPCWTGSAPTPPSIRSAPRWPSRCCARTPRSG